MKKAYAFWIFFVMVVLGVVLSAQPATANDAPVIAPTRLDFDASQMPKNCNDEREFNTILANWVPRDALRIKAERSLEVRIRRSHAGGKLVDLTFVAANGATPIEEHKTFPGKIECHKVLYDTALAAATLMGAFEKPLPPEPCPTCPALPAPVRCPVSAPLPPIPATLPRPVRMTLPASRRASIGAGVFLGMTTKPDAFVGPSLSFGFVPFYHWPDFQIEFDGAWVSPNAPEGLRVHAMPVFASLCHAHHGLRLCSGLVTMLLSAEHAKDARDFTVAASLRIGTEFELVGPLSIRLDVFSLLPLTQRTPLSTLNQIVAGAVAMGVWSFH